MRRDTMEWNADSTIINLSFDEKLMKNQDKWRQIVKSVIGISTEVDFTTSESQVTKWKT